MPQQAFAGLMCSTIGVASKDVYKRQQHLMQIIKRNGATESYDREKIAVAIRNSFASTQKEITDEAVYTLSLIHI